MSAVRATESSSESRGRPCAWSEGGEAVALTARQRLALVIGGKLTAQEALSASDADIDHAFFLRHGVDATTLTSVGIGPRQLKRRGAADPARLCALGFGAIDLCDASFCTDAVAAYGADAVVAAFVSRPADALLLAGTSAAEQLGLDMGTLLSMCKGDPGLAHQVLLQARSRAQGLAGVAPLTLLETGLRKSQLGALGYGRNDVARQTRATEAQLRELGF